MTPTDLDRLAALLAVREPGRDSAPRAWTEEEYDEAHALAETRLDELMAAGAAAQFYSWQDADEIDTLSTLLDE